MYVNKFLQVQVVFPTIVTGNMEQFVANPEEFRPERWLETDGRLHSFASLPYGFGARICLGRRFADLEIQVLLAKVLLFLRMCIVFGLLLDITVDTTINFLWSICNWYFYENFLSLPTDLKKRWGSELDCFFLLEKKRVYIHLQSKINIEIALLLLSFFVFFHKSP